MDPDAALMLRVKDGDIHAFEELVQKSKHPIVNVIYRMLHDLDEAEDLAQNVFIRVFQSAGRYEVSAKFSTWIFTIARHLSLNEIRRRGRHPHDHLPLPVADPEGQVGVTVSHTPGRQRPARAPGNTVSAASRRLA